MKTEGSGASVSVSVVICSLAAVCWDVITALLGGCGKTGSKAEAPAPTPGRQDGERFETTVMVEGMEESVGYEHVRSEALGFELDYDYEMLERFSEGERERFLARGEDPEDPWNYFELRAVPGGSEAVTAALSANLADAYDKVEASPYTLAGAGACTLLDASGAKEGKALSGSLQSVYVIPAGERCLVAAVHCTMESAGGFGVRVSQILNTLTLIGK